ncbi:hypothetical protein [Nocardioides ungokensis]|uniref:hypothetical protein n=1 Tax=Nocardioides ungokensis TaxID=1643322 RepID=UPI001FE8EE4C|nr:hypothetical protein [Nocardioides ungokensis]
MPTLSATRLQRMLPPTPLARRLSSQSVLFAVGEGFFLTGSAVFFTRIVGLSAAQVGLGLTIAGVVSFFFAVPLGRSRTGSAPSGCGPWVRSRRRCSTWPGRGSRASWPSPR